jgi:hypothetical protein
MCVYDVGGVACFADRVCGSPLRLSQYVVFKKLATVAEQAAMRQEHGERITLFKQADMGSSVIDAGDNVRTAVTRDWVCERSSGCVHAKRWSVCCSSTR